MALVDPRRTIASMERAETNIRFGIARGLTRAAQEASADVKKAIPAKFDRPIAFTQNATAITPAKREDLTAVVFVKRIQAGYLLMEETGGVRTPKPGSPINIPVQQRTNAYGNIPRGAIGRLRAKPDTFVASGKGDTRHLPPGIYQRLKPKKGQRRKTAAIAPGLKLLVAFEKRAEYKPRFGFRVTVLSSARAKAPGLIAASVRQALLTAR